MVCPRLPLMTQVQHFVSELRRGRDETYRRCELLTLIFDLETGVQLARVVEYPPVNFGDTMTRRPNVNERGETSSLSIDQLGPIAATLAA